jgi:hypothetical protein
MKSGSILITTVFAALMMIGFVPGASADPVDITLATTPLAYGEDTDMPDIESIILPLMGDVDELYRVTPVAGAPNLEQFSLAGSYETVFSGDNEGAVITYIGGPFIGPTAYLLAKDGAAKDENPLTHAWYLFDLTALGWTGIEQITLAGLWPDQGSFSHISMYGSTDTTVPEPQTLVLLGFGLLGLLGVKKFKK